MKVKHDKTKCIKCGLCAAIAPEVFEMGPDGNINLKMDEITDPELMEKVKKAAESCPVGAISIVEE